MEHDNTVSTHPATPALELMALEERLRRDVSELRIKLYGLRRRIRKLEHFQFKVLTVVSHARTALIVLCLVSIPQAYTTLLSLLHMLGL